jgi:hypothetical protein
METRTVEVSSEVAAGLTEAIQEQVAAITADGGTLVSVRLTPPTPALSASAGQPGLTAQITYAAEVPRPIEQA